MSTQPGSKRRKTALITGASGGIGYELAKLFARDGYDLVLVARSESKLGQLATELKERFSTSVIVLVKDLSKPSSPEEIFAQLQTQSVRVDVLVNNAGFGGYGLFSQTDLTMELEMMQVNMVSLTHLTKLFLKDMLAQGEGKILNLASTAAFQPGPLMAVYFATKAYVLSFSEALAEELRGSGVTVTALCPGPTATGFKKRATLEASKLFTGQVMDSKTVAELGYRGLFNNQTVVVTGLRNQIMAFSVRFMPRDMLTQAVKRMQQSI